MLALRVSRRSSDVASRPAPGRRPPSGRAVAAWSTKKQSRLGIPPLVGQGCIAFRTGRNLALEVLKVFEVGSGQSTALQNRKPLLDLVHPRAVHRREVHLEAWMTGQPRSHQLAVVYADVVTHQMDDLNGRRVFCVDGFQQLDELHLTLASAQNPDDLTAAQIEGSEQLQGSLAGVLLLEQSRLIAGLRWLGFV